MSPERCTTSWCAGSTSQPSSMMTKTGRSFWSGWERMSIEAKCSIYAWALMTNHVHLLFKSGKKGISTVMRKLLTWYAIYYNRRHKRTGHLFENRYKSILCDEDNLSPRPDPVYPLESAAGGAGEDT